MAAVWELAQKKEYYKKNRDKIKARTLKNYHDNIEKCKAQRLKYRQENRISICERQRQRDIQNKEKELIKYFKRRQLERNYKPRRKELNAKRKESGYFKTEEYKLKQKLYREKNIEKIRARDRKRKRKKKLANGKSL